MAENYDASEEVQGMNCRTSCETKDHISWGECARAASINVGNLK